jgi:uncharacterized protein
MIKGVLCIFLFSCSSWAFEKKSLVFSSGKTITVEIAKTNEEKAKGLMYRKELLNDTGMLFVFEYQQKLSFWMKNTYVPLTIGFFDARMKLLETKDMQPHLGPVADDKLPHYESTQAAKYALEMPIGWFVKNKIKLGTTFRFK